jgi:hypothetical protein
MRGVTTIGSVGYVGYSGPVGLQILSVKTSPALIGGKTGTGQIDNTHSPMTWFVSLAPDDITNPTGNPPRLSVIVQKLNDGEGACQAPISKDIMEFALPKLGFTINK